MTKRIDRNQTFDSDGNLIAEEVVEVIEYPLPEESLIAAARLVVLPKIAADELKDEAAEAFAGLFPDWEPGIAVNVGEVYRWDGTLVEVIQAHTTQADWTPIVVPALFKIHRTPDMTEWVAGISVNVGEQLTYQGATYQVVQAHTTQVGWEPPNVPALWSLVP